jgi:hypothetical protein
VKDVAENSPDNCERIYTGVGIEMPVLFGNDGLFQQRRDFIQFRFHPPFLVFGEVGIYHISFIISYNSGVFNLIPQWKNPVKEEEQQYQPKEADAQPFEETGYSLFSNAEFSFFH